MMRAGGFARRMRRVPDRELIEERAKPELACGYQRDGFIDLAGT
jgi:hypothetical protein